jgi:hypothetical protein
MESPSLLIETTKAPIVTCERESDEAMSVALVRACSAAGIDVFEKEDTLADQFDADSLDSIDWQSNNSVLLAFTLWGHRAVLTSESVRIYTPS